nr:putative ribonuclease H-like domain-containing protein [Tanacetum cinerariifolium]
MSYLSDFEEINGGYVAFGRNPKGGKITRKVKTRTGKLDFDVVYFVKELKFNLFSVSQMCDKKHSVLFTDTKCIILSSDFKILDENHVLLRVPRENNMYNVDLKNIIPSGDLTCLFAKATLDESNLWHRRLGHINSKTMNKLVKNPLGKFNGKADEGFLVGYSNTDDDVTFEVKEPEFEVYVSLSSSAKTKKHDDKTKREAKGKSPVELSTGVRNLSEEFEDFFDNSINKVNAASTPVPAVGQNSTNNTNTFSAAGPSNTAVYMPALEDITYSDDEEDVATQTRSTTKMVKDQGRLTQINNEDFHTCMFTCFLSQEEPKRVHQALKDLSWIEAMQEKLLQFKMQKVWELVDLPKGHTQEEGIDYEEVFAPVARIEAIRLFLAYSFFMGFKDLKTLIILIRFIKWSKHSTDYIKLLELGMRPWPIIFWRMVFRGKIDQTLFIKKQKGDILLVQVYVDDIIFGFTNKDLCKAFKKLMKDKFQMSSMGESYVLPFSKKNGLK